MTIHPRQSTATTQARRRFLVGLTFFHAAIIAMAGPVLGKQLEFTFRALFDDDSPLHIMGESLVVALFGALTQAIRKVKMPSS